MYQISFYVPEPSAEKVKEKMFEAGAGRWGNYDKCSFEYKGIGQFRPIAGSNPFLGSQGQLEQVAELKVEMICVEDCLQQVVRALKETHPYETPAYYITKIVGH